MAAALNDVPRLTASVNGNTQLSRLAGLSITEMSSEEADMCRTAARRRGITLFAQRLSPVVEEPRGPFSSVVELCRQPSSKQ
jgi:hypothetical protein